MRISLLTLILTTSLVGSAWAACPDGDLNGDCEVNSLDLGIFVEQWLDPPGCLAHPNDCANIDGINGIDMSDFALLAANWLIKTGSLQVTILPPEAVAAGAQWRVDGGSWQDNGHTEPGLTVGSHTVEYSTISGWSKPADEIVQINDGLTTTTSGTYTQQAGSLQVALSPQAAIDAGAQWRVDGGSPAGVSMVAYNDCVYDGNDQYIANNVTTYGIGDRYTGPTSGPLLDLVTGADTRITATLTQSGNVTWQSEPTNGGSDCAVGTDANNTFAGITDMTGVIYYGDLGWWIELTFTGLDPSAEYTFATSANRGNPTYIDRWTIYTLVGADSYTNSSTSGVDVLAENKVRFNTGDNYNDGFVARWTGITASDGTFTVRAEADPNTPESRKAYSFDVFMLEQQSSDTWRNSGYTEAGLSVGSHTVEYSTVTGWNKPADEVVQINDGLTTT
jgi:hypothetical protein